jgi:hypothetical protein
MALGQIAGKESRLLQGGLPLVRGLGTYQYSISCSSENSQTRRCNSFLEYTPAGADHHDLREAVQIGVA